VQLCLTSTASALLRSPRARVLYVSTKASFPSARLSDLVRETLQLRHSMLQALNGEPDMCATCPAYAELLAESARKQGLRGSLEDAATRKAVEARLLTDPQAAIGEEVRMALRRVLVVNVFDGHSLLAVLRDIIAQLEGVDDDVATASAAASESGADSGSGGSGTGGGSGEKDVPVPTEGFAGMLGNPAAAIPRIRIDPPASSSAAVTASSQRSGTSAGPGAAPSTGSAGAALQTQLLVIDSISGAVGSTLGGSKNYTGHALMCEAGKLMQFVAKRFHVAVVVTNNVVVDRGGDGSGAQGAESGNTAGWRPALGPSWSYVPDTTVALTHLQQGTLYDRSASITGAAYLLKSNGRVLAREAVSPAALAADPMSVLAPFTVPANISTATL
jgi:hypothetical protein